MYNRRIKKAILFFNAAIVTCAFCLGSRAQAASASLAFNFSPATYNAYLIYSENIDYEDDGSGVTQVSGNPTYVYECNIPVYLTISSSDVYIYGNLYERYALTATIPSGFQQAAIDISYVDSSPDFVYSGLTNRGTSPLSYTVGLRAYFTDFFSPFNSSGTVMLGTIMYRISLKSTGSGATHSPYITVSIGSAGSLSNSTTISATPSGMQFVEVIKQSILDALDTDIYGSGSDAYGVADILQIYAQYLYAMDIRQEAIDNNISTLVTDIAIALQNQSQQLNKLEQLRSALVAFNTSYVQWSGRFDTQIQHIQYQLDQLINLGTTQTEGASEAQEAVNQLQSADAALQQPTLSDGDIFNPIDNAAAEYGDDAANIFWWTWDGRISLILTLVVSLGLVGFIIYGKSG